MGILKLFNLADIDLPEVNDLTPRLYQNRIHQHLHSQIFVKKCQLFEFYWNYFSPHFRHDSCSDNAISL